MLLSYVFSFQELEMKDSETKKDKLQHNFEG